MNYQFCTLINFFNNIDPSPLFVLSLIPYLFFLFYAKRSISIPRISLIGFTLTILFVFMTIIFALISLYFFKDDLTNVDPLHGAAESFLTLSDGLIAYGFVQALQNKDVKNS